MPFESSCCPEEGEGGAQDATTFDALTDTPPSKIGFANQFARVNATETALEYAPNAVSTAWGDITGVITAQVDLQNELNDKLSLTGGALTGAVTSTSTMTATSFNAVALSAAGINSRYLDETGNYSIPAPGNAIDTVFVTQEADFGSTIIINGDSYYQLNASIKYVLLNDISLTSGFSLEGDSDIVVTSSSFYSAKLLWDGFSTVTNPIIREAGDSDSFTLEGITVINNIFGANNYFIETQHDIFIKNSRIAGFNKAVNSSGTLQIMDSEISGLTDGGIDIQVLGKRNYIYNCRILSGSIGAGESVIKISGSGNAIQPDHMFVFKNYIQNGFGSSFAFNIDSGLQVNDTINFTENSFLFPNDVFDTAGGSLDENDPRIQTLHNEGVSNNFSSNPIVAGFFNGVPLTTAGVATNFLDETGNYSVPVIISSPSVAHFYDNTTALISSLTTVVNVPAQIQDWSALITGTQNNDFTYDTTLNDQGFIYTGTDTKKIWCTLLLIVDSTTDDVGGAVGVNGVVPALADFRTIDTSPEAEVTVSFLFSLATNDKLRVYLVNKSASATFNFRNTSIALTEA